MQKKLVKAVTASLMAAAMLSTTAATFAPMSVSAGMCVGETSFNKKGLPWHTCETNPAKQTFAIENGAYTVKIVNPGGEMREGEDRWDLQFRHRKLKIQKDHKYHISYTVTATNSGNFNTHITDLKGGNDNLVWHNNVGCENGIDQGWNTVQIQANQPYTYDGTFTAIKDVPVAEWAFHYGGGGSVTNTLGQDCFPEGTEITFDNMILECTSCPDSYSKDSCNWDPSDDFGVINRDNSGLENNFISVNQVGYYTKLSKKATLGDNAGGAKDDQTTITLPDTALQYEILDESGKAVWSGDTIPSGNDEASGDNVHIIDFSEFTTPGTYSIKCGEYVSFPFEISDDIYGGTEHNLLADAMNYYYQNRSGINISADMITSGDKSALAHTKGHDPDMAYVQSEWVKSYAGEFNGDKTKQIDGTGGWYDAGDHGKYVVNGGISVWTLQNIYEVEKKNDKADKWDDGKTIAKLPGNESSDGAPDILNEARYEVEWMEKMIVQSSDPYWGDKAGLVYHKLHDHKWTGLAVKPDTYENEWGTTRIVKPPSFAATLNFVASAAQAARLWEDYDKEFSDKCLKLAKESYAAYLKNYYPYTDAEKSNKKSLYAPMDQAIGGGAYGDTNVEDDAYWAACELYAATGDSTYYNDLKKYSGAFEVVTKVEGGENNGSFGSFNWGNTASLGSLTLYLNKDNLSLAADEIEKIESTLTAAADAYIDKENSEGYGIPYESATFQDSVNIGEGIDVTGYEWGSNSFVVNNAIVMAYAYDATKDKKYLDGASTAMDYIFGRNPLSFSYVSGYGSYSLSRPHHRLWSNELDPEFPMAPDGALSGGPGSGMQDPYIGGLGFKRGTLAPQRCYVDSIEAWSVNEVTINWNAPLVWMVSYLQDEAPNVSAEVSDKLTVTPSKVDLEVGESATITAKLGNETVTIDSMTSSSDAVEVSGNTIKAVGESKEPVIVTVKVGDKTATVTVNIKPEATTDPDSPTIDTSKPATKWGDVDCNNEVEVNDIVALNMYLLDVKSNIPEVTEQGLINANCEFDDYIDLSDAAKLINYLAELIPYEDLGNQ